MTDAGLTGMHHELGGAMVELIRLKRLDEAHIVHNLREMREAIRYPGSGVSVLLEWILRTEHIGRALNECEILAFEEGLGTGLTVESLQIGFVIKEFQLARGADHVKVNDALRFASKLRRQGIEWIRNIMRRQTMATCSSVCLAGKEHRPETGGAAIEKLAARLTLQRAAIGFVE